MQHEIDKTKNNKRLTAATLPVVLVISVLILLLVSFVYSLWNINFLYFASYHYQRQQLENIKSGIVLYNNDSTFLTGYNIDKDYRLYDADSTSDINCKVRRWGMYEYIRVTSQDKKFSSTKLLGKKHECDYRAALWLCDRNRALSLSGDTELRGKIYIPLNGINYTEINSEYYKGKEIPFDQMGIADAGLPAIDSCNMDNMTMLKDSVSLSVPLPAIPYAYNSFNNPTLFFRKSDEEQNDIFLQGNSVLFADDLVISPESKINDIIVFARKVTIESGFSGSLQICCTDTVLIEENVKLQYPSGIYLKAEINYPFVSLSDNSELNGYVIILGKIKDDELLFPSYRQFPNSIFRGLLYVDGTTHIEGTLSGAVYLKDCFFTSDQNVYAGTLHNTRILRNNDIAYPIFLSGKYTRTNIKSIY
jgi:hypothetical protein